MAEKMATRPGLTGRRGGARDAIVPVLLLIGAVGLLGGSAAEPADVAAGRDTADVAHSLGWLDGRCLAFPDSALPLGTALAVAALGPEQEVAEASVVGPATEAGPCARLSSRGSGTVNGGAAALYEVSEWASEPGIVGIAWTGPAAALRVVDGRVSGDLDGDGVPEAFTVCASAEGLHFAVWRGAPFTGPALWRGYDYVGYDLEADCPPGALSGG